VYVKVDGLQSASIAWPSTSAAASQGSMSLSQTAVTLTISQSMNVYASGVSGTLSIPGNTNTSVANAYLNGSTIVVTGQSSGTAVITVCDSQSGCSSINVTVQPDYLSSPAVYVSPASFTMNVGQVQTLSITGYASAPYYVSNNSNTSAVTTSINGSSVIVTALAVGSSNMTICSTGGQCGTAFVNVLTNGSSGPSQTVTVNPTIPPVISSMTISTNGIGNSFVGAESVLSFSFNVNQSVTNPSMTVGNMQVPVNGSGSGPYTASYTVTGNETQPIAVAVSLTNLSGLTGKTYFWAGNSYVSPTQTVVAPSVTTPSVVTSAPSGSYTFGNYLYAGMTKLGVSDSDVVALQKRLKADGFFDGAATGYFGPQTKTALKAYQKKNGLSQIGVVGPSTRALLNQGI